MNPILPSYCTPPNKLSRYEEIERVCRAGNRYIERVAIFLNKKGQECTATAQIIWKDVPHGKR